MHSPLFRHPHLFRHAIGTPGDIHQQKESDQVIILIHYKYNNMMVLILLLAGLICFWIFFKSIDFFENV